MIVRIEVKQGLERADVEIIVYPHTRTTLQTQGHIRMDSQEPISASSAAPKGKRSSKPKGKPTEAPKGKRSLNLSLPQEDYERLAIHAMRADTTISELVCQLARTHLREFHLTRTPTRTGEPDAA